MTAARGNAHAPSRRRRWPLLLGAVAAAAAGLLLLLFVAPRLIPSGWLIPRLEQLLSRALGTPVQVASAQATSFLPLTIVVENVTLGQQRPDARLTGTIRQGEFGIGWLNLFRRRPTFTHLHLVEADLQLPTSTAAGPSGQWRPYPAPAAPHLPVRLSDPSHRVFHHPDLMLYLAADTPTDTNAEMFTIEQLTVQNSRLSWPDTPFQFERLNTEGRVQGREVVLRQTTANWLNGTLEASAVRLTFAPERLGFAITGRLTNMATEKLASPPETAAVTGQGTFRLDIAGQYRYETRNFEGLSGSGDGDLREGRFPRLRPGAIGRTLPPALPMRLGNFDLGPLHERLPGTESELPSTSEGLSFRELTFRFALEGTTVRLDGLTCTIAEDRQIFGQGVISLAERPARINFDLRFPLNFVTGRSASGLPFLGTLSERQMIPVRVTGTFERPVVEIISLSL
ncbi:hypothetical protein J8C02_14385 [Chloracidobacterium sp. MS 40/45]|uniref:AsmA-like C-terminal region-containing protein n=1 Tax=Chloracidobacterium aggregatum TaxID=2851959 RepID=UPI001B8B6C38|nr:AsmA-like C-terminal region-containing protein [Chloracidobacterium aggregatum]QUW01323.1 hypothetical protein J8C02_14385 [Chloracidobacterium sp. MS 40/45]